MSSMPCVNKPLPQKLPVYLWDQCDPGCSPGGSYHALRLTNLRGSVLRHTAVFIGVRQKVNTATSLRVVKMRWGPTLRHRNDPLKFTDCLRRRNQSSNGPRGIKYCDLLSGRTIHVSASIVSWCPVSISTFTPHTLILCA